MWSTSSHYLPLPPFGFGFGMGIVIGFFAIAFLRYQFLTFAQSTQLRFLNLIVRVPLVDAGHPIELNAERRR